MKPSNKENEPEPPVSASHGMTKESASPLLLDLLQKPFAKKQRHVRSEDAYDRDSENFVGLRMIDGIVDFETGERAAALDERAESVGELLGGA